MYSCYRFLRSNFSAFDFWANCVYLSHHFYHIYVLQNLIKSDIHNHPYKHWEEQRKIQQLDNVLKYNGTLSFRDAQHNEANKQFKGQQDALRNTKKSRMPDGVAEKLQKEFAKYKPHEPEGGPK